MLPVKVSRGIVRTTLPASTTVIFLLLATLRTALEGSKAELVLFVHDEVVVHCPAEQAEQVVAAVHASAAQAGRLLFGDTAVRFPLDVSVVGAYADAK
jgi:DNA polymerase-1